MAKTASRPSLTSSMKSTESSLTFQLKLSIPERMHAKGPNAPLPPRRNSTWPPNVTTTSKTPTGPPTRPPLRASSEFPTRPKLSKRFSEPVPISREDGRRLSTPVQPAASRTSSARPIPFGSRVSSYQSAASAPAALESTPPPTQTPLTQYDPIQHYLPCGFQNCKVHYTPSLLGPTFYYPQQPYRLLRKTGLCPQHANQDLELANHEAKRTWDSMRQNAGRKTLGTTFAEFEIWLQQLREDMNAESESLSAKQSHKVLGSFCGCTSAKDATGRLPDEWDWQYSPRICTHRGCAQESYSPYDNRLYLFYHTPRRSSLVPLSTLCPTCALADVKAAEQKLEACRMDSRDGVEWRQWVEDIKGDRVMEQEFWEQAQQKLVFQSMAAHPIVAVPEEAPRESSVAKTKGKRGERLSMWLYNKISKVGRRPVVAV